VGVLLLQFVIAPGLVAAATLAARIWGHAAAGLLSAFPAIVGPVLLIGAVAHGPAFAARSAVGTLLGLVTLSGFVVAYARIAPYAGWPLSLAAGWAVAAVLALAVGSLDIGLGAALATGVLSLALAGRALPRGTAPLAPAPPPRWDLPVRMAMTALLVLALAAAASRLGPTAGGILAALPVLACILAAFTHEQHGAEAVAQLLRGMVAGMAGFVVFCALVAGLVERAGIAAAFALATLAALAAQIAVARVSAGAHRVGPVHDG
jgi:hypothetical protein